MRTKEEEQAAAKARYEEFLAVMVEMSKAQNKIQFEILPNPSLFAKMHDNNSATPLLVEFKSKSTGAKFTIENKFYPDSWIINIPEKASKEEKDCFRDIILDTIAHPKNAPPGYKPQVLICFPEGTPEKEIFEFVEAAQQKGIQVSLFVGPISEFEKIREEHAQKTKEVIASGNLDKLPGWNGLLSEVQKSAGGKKGEEMLEKYNNPEHSSSFHAELR